MADTTNYSDIKYFLTSDGVFLISLDKISLIKSVILSQDNESPVLKIFYTYLDGTRKTIDIQNHANRERGSYFDIYLDGVDSPIKLKYTDGVMLMNILGAKNNKQIFYNKNYPGQVTSYTYVSNSTEQIGYFPSVDATTGVDRNIGFYKTVNPYFLQNCVTNYTYQSNYTGALI